MTRNLTNIADGIIKIIDKECTFNENVIKDIVSDIEKVKNSSRYRAPELQFISWRELAEVLSKYFDPSNSEWEEKIRKLFANEISLDEI